MMPRNQNKMLAGATPNVTSSAKESSSLPIGLDTPRTRAVIPSKKSKTAPRMMNSRAISGMPNKANTVATHPEIRLQQVIVFGICFFIFMIRNKVKGRKPLVS